MLSKLFQAVVLFLSLSHHDDSHDHTHEEETHAIVAEHRHLETALATA